MEPVCFFCQEYETDVGHQTILCPKLICKKCHQIGHFAMDCEIFCDKVHEVKEQNNIDNSISEVEDLRNQLKSVKTQVEELEVELKISQGKLASLRRMWKTISNSSRPKKSSLQDPSLTGQKNELKNKVPANWRALKLQKNRQFVEKSWDEQKNELQFVKVANQELFQKIEEFEMKKQTFANNDSLDRNLEIKVEDKTTLEIQENEISTKRKRNQESFKSNTKKKLEAQAQSFQGKFTTWAFRAGKLSGGVPVGASMGISIPPPMNTPPPSLPGIMRPPPGIPPLGAQGVPLGTGPPQGLPPNMMGQLRPGMGLPIGHPHMMGPLRPGMGPPMGPPPMGGMPLGPRSRMMPPNMNLRPQ